MIIQYLLNSNYVSSSDIKDFLKSKGIEAQARTIQRDLVQLQEVIPLEVRKDDKPYSWRWKRLNTQKHQLSMSQAIALRVVETELQGVIPDEVYHSLLPLFIKSRYVTGLASMETDSDCENNPLIKHAVPQSRNLFKRISKMLPKRSAGVSEKVVMMDKEDKASMDILIGHLQKHKMSVLVDLLENELMYDVYKN